MTARAARPSTALPPVHSATVIAPQNRPIRFSELFGTLKQIAPSVKVGTWTSPDLAASPADDHGVEMIAVDGHRLAVFVFDRPAPAITFEIGMLGNMFMRDPAAACRGHRSHVNVMRTKAPQSRAEAVALSRAVTLVAMAVARVVNAIAVKWTDADHIVPPSVVEQTLPWLVPPRGIAPALWARVLVYRGPQQSTGATTWTRLLLRRGPPQPADAATLVVGTVGLHAFGLRDLEYPPVFAVNPEAAAGGAPDGEDLMIKLPEGMLAHPLATSEYLLNAGANLKEGATLGDPGHGGFRIALKPRGYFLDKPVCLLTPIEVPNAGAGNAARSWLKYDDSVPPFQGTRPLHSPSVSNAALHVALNEGLAGWREKYLQSVEKVGEPVARDIARIQIRSVWDGIWKKIDREARN